MENLPYLDIVANCHMFFKPTDTIMVAISPRIGVGPGFDSQGSVTLFLKYCFPNLRWIHGKACEVETWGPGLLTTQKSIYSLLTNHGKWLTKRGKTQEWHTKKHKATLLRLFCPQKPHHLQQHKIEPSPSSWKQIWPPCPACGCWGRPPPLLAFAGPLPECLAEDDKFGPEWNDISLES